VSHLSAINAAETLCALTESGYCQEKYSESYNENERKQSTMIPAHRVAHAVVLCVSIILADWNTQVEKPATVNTVSLPEYLRDAEHSTDN